MKKIKNSILNILLNEKLFVWLVGLTIMVFWATNLWIFGILILCSFVAITLSFCRDTSRILSILFMFVTTISLNCHKLNGLLWVLFLGVGLLFLGLIIHIIRFRPSFKKVFIEKKVKGFSLALILLIIPVALGGVGRGDTNIFVILLAVALFLAISIFYLFFMATSDSKKNDEMLKLVIHIMFVTGIVITLQMLIYYLRLENFDAILETMKYKKINVGWGGPNNVAPFLALTLPSCFYYAIKSKKFAFVYIIIAIIEYLFIFSTCSRGAILFTTLAFPFMICYAMAKAENKLMVGLSISICFCIIFSLIALYGPKLFSVFERMFSYGLDDNGRIELYKEALATFKKFPIFGAGWDYRLGEMAEDGYTPYWYHNTVLQILANMGIFGLIIFAYFAFWRYRSCITKNYTTAKLTVFSGMLIFELYGMVDVNFFGPTFFISMVIMSFAIEKSLSQDQCNTILLKNIFKKIHKSPNNDKI